MKTSPYSLKGVKTLGGREGYAWNATIMRDNSFKVGTAIQDGNGGNTNISYVSALERKLMQDYCAGLPQIDIGDARRPCIITQDDEWVVDQLFEDEMENKKLKRICKKETVFRLPEDKEGNWRVVKTPYTPGIKLSLEAKYKKVEFANERFGA